MRFFSLAILGLSLNAYAADEVSTAESGSFVSHVYAGLTSTFHGATLGDLGSRRSVDHNGNVSQFSPVNFDSELGTGYKLGHDTKLGVVVPFLVFPSAGENFSLGDIGVKISDGQTIATEHFTLATNLILQAPTSDYSRQKNLKLGIKTTPYARYEIPESNWTLGAFTELKEYLGVTSDKNFKVWALPYVKYQLAKSFALNLAYEMEWRHMAKQEGLGLGNYAQDLQPGFIWWPTKKISVNPYLQLYTRNTLTSDKTAVGAFVSAALL